MGLRGRGLPPEFGAVGSRRQLDSDRMIRTVLSEIVLGELFPDFVRCYADDRVLACVEGFRKLEEFDTDCAFFESAIGPSNRVFDDVLQELSASLARPKGGAVE